jgi:hypothetical protein
MKKALLVLAIIWTALLSGCPQPTDYTEGDNTGSDAKLKVQNQSSVTLTSVKWGGQEFYTAFQPSASKTVDVAEGSSYLFFTLIGMGRIECRTQEVITVNKDETKALTLTDNTLVVALDDTNNPQALGTIAARVNPVDPW